MVIITLWIERKYDHYRGENVYPSEVENIIGAHPAVKDVAVIGVLMKMG